MTRYQAYMASPASGLTHSNPYTGNVKGGSTNVAVTHPVATAPAHSQARQKPATIRNATRGLLSTSSNRARAPAAKADLNAPGPRVG